MSDLAPMPEMLFEFGAVAHARRPLPFSPYLPQRGRGAWPSYQSRIPAGTNIATAEQGAILQDLPLLPQGRRIAGVLEAKASDGSPLYPTSVILVPRRATKTTSIWSTLLGRCWYHPGYKIVTTAQDGIRARNRFREVLRSLERLGFEARGYGKLRWSNGDEAIEFDNGARIWVVPPEAGAFRGEAADAMLFDEAGELSLSQSEDLLAGALPLMDTRPQGQVIIAGTPAEQRAGLLWDTLSTARRNTKRTGIVDYSIRDDESAIVTDEDGTVRLNEAVVRRVHPGVGTLTTMKVIRDRFERMPLAKFEAEYLCRFPFDVSVSAIDAAAWSTCGTGDPLPPAPRDAAIAYDVDPAGMFSAVCRAWRDSTGRAHLEVVAYKPGTAWVPEVAATAYRKHRTPVALDPVGANIDIADQLARRHRTATRRLPLRELQGAAARLVSEIHADNLTHYRQPDLDEAVAGASWRPVGDGGRLFGRKASTANVGPLVAASIALWTYDERGSREPLTIVHAGGD